MEPTNCPLKSRIICSAEPFLTKLCDQEAHPILVFADFTPETQFPPGSKQTCDEIS